MLTRIELLQLADQVARGELGKTYEPKRVILPTEEEVDRYSAFDCTDGIIPQIQNKQDSVLILPTGRTSIGLYRLIREEFQKKPVTLHGVTLFNLDEYWPINPNHPSSYNMFMRNQLFDHVDIQPERCHIPNSAAPNVDEEAKRYQTLIDGFNIDLAVLGIGPGNTCHIGFNEKRSTPSSRVRYVELDSETRATNATLFEDPSEMPTGAITLGIADILRARKILLIAKGENKAWGINRTLKGPIGADAPASFLRFHPRVTFVMDPKAAAYL